MLATTEEGIAYISDPLNNYQSDKQLKAKIEEGTKILELENNKFLFKEEEGPYKIWSIDKMKVLALLKKIWINMKHFPMKESLLMQVAIKLC